MQDEEIMFFEFDEEQIVTKPELDLDDLGLFDEKYESNEIKEIWNYIENNNVEELEKYLFVKEGLSTNSDETLCLKAIISYLKQDKQAPKLMIEVIKSVNYKNPRYFEFLMFIADRLKQFFDDKKTLLSISSYVIQNTLYFQNNKVNYFNNVFKIICESGFYLLQNANLTNEEKRDIYNILFYFLYDFDYSNLDTDNYKIYLKYYTRVLWVLRDEFPDLVKQLFSPLFEGIIYKSMELDTEEEKIKKLTLFGIDEAVAKELVKILRV